MEEKKVKKLFILNIIMMTFSTIISVYAASYLFESEQVSYDNTSSGLTSTNVQDSLDELYNHATDYTEIKSYFQESPSSYFYGKTLRIGANSTDATANPGLILYKDANSRAARFAYNSTDDVTYIDSYNTSGSVGRGKLSLRGDTINIGNSSNNATVQINGSEVAKKPVRISQTTYFTSSTTLAYTGVSYTVPANSIYFIRVNAVYSNSQPTNVGISTSSTTFNDKASGLRGIHNAYAVVAGKTGSGAVTYYVWATYGGVSQNYIDINGFYISD